jgi:hypothetical protein
VRDIYKHFRKIVHAAADEGYVTTNPCKRIQLPKADGAEQRFLTEAEVESLVAAMDERYQ